MILTLERKAGETPQLHPEGTEQPEDEARSERAIVCAKCKHPITSERHAIEAFGSHLHDRVNPAGIAFRLRLFDGAQGASSVGPWRDEFPWFPKQRWRVVLCGGCFDHIGWCFSGDGASLFWGLIADAIEDRA